MRAGLNMQSAVRVRERWKLRCSTARNRSGAGNFAAGVTLLVGERVSHTDEKYHAPFCSSKGSSGWLNELLAASTIKEADLFWINALDNDGTVMELAKLVEDLKPSKVVALGKVAERILTEQDVEHDAVPHPQYWKRFKHHKPYPLIQLLETHVNLRKDA